MNVVVRLTLLVLLLLVVSAISLNVGAVRIPISSVFKSLTNPSTQAIHTDIIWRLRAPRIALAILLGAGLGCAGAGYQGLFRNALADPFVIGASSGAALGATLAIINQIRGQWWGLDLISLSAMGGALLVVAIVYLIASAGHTIPTLALLLAGIAVSSFVGAVVSLLMFMHQMQLSQIFGWLMGSISPRSWHDVTAVIPLIALGTTAMWLMSRPLDVLAFGDETAQALGFNLNRVRAAIVIAASITTAAAVAAAGIIGFIGLIAPHAARFIMGSPRHAGVIPASCLTGGILLLAADSAARTAAAPSELPVGVVTALLGGPFFLYLLRMRRHQLERRT